MIASAIMHALMRFGDVPALDLAARYGTPLYVYDAAVLRRQIERVRRAFVRIPLTPFYAMKANSNLALMRIIREAGFGCDAVSPGEIFIAQRAGFDPEHIWFTCSNVSDDDLRAIPHPRIVINVNSMSEIDRVLALDLPNPIAIRVNPDVGAGHHADVVTAGGGVKFGVDLAEVEEARLVVEDTGRKVIGIHSHIGSGVDTIAPLLQAARTLGELAPSFPNLQWINFGGGFSIPYRPGEAEFPIDEYATALCDAIEPVLRKHELRAIVEPGRYLVAQCGTLLARVTSKRVSGGVTWVGVDSGFNHLVRPSKYNSYHHIVNAAPHDDAAEEVVVAGNICESSDVFTRDPTGRAITREIRSTRVGDLLAFRDAGAYGFSMASHYNARLLPAEVLVEGEDVRVIRERQTYDDLLKGMG